MVGSTEAEAAPAVRSGARRRTWAALAALGRAMRPRQWVKNGVLLAGILFTLDQRHPLSDWLRVAAGVAVFCLLSSAVYLLNDLCDVEQDRKHPRKRLRPLAAGEIGAGTAGAAAGALGALALAGAAALGSPFAVVAACYLALTLAYSLRLKHAVILDVMALAGGFVLRAAAGAVVIDVVISPWLLICTTLGALMLGLAKRRSELLTLEDAVGHRRSLNDYTLPMLDQMIGIVSAATLVAYMLYAFHSRTATVRPMMLTIPPVVYGVFRYLYLVHRRGKGGDPSADLLEDRSMLVCGLVWIAACVAAMLLR